MPCVCWLSSSGINSLQKKTKNFNHAKGARQPFFFCCCYNALLLQSQGCIEESGFSLWSCFHRFFSQAKQQKVPFERAQMRPQPVLVDLGASASLSRCCFLCRMRRFGAVVLSTQAGHRKKTQKTTALLHKESWRDGEKTGDHVVCKCSWPSAGPGTIAPVCQTDTQMSGNAISQLLEEAPVQINRYKCPEK